MEELTLSEAHVRASRPASSQHRSSSKESWGGKRHIPAASLAVGLDRHHPRRTARTSTWSPAPPTLSGVRRRERKRVVVSDGQTEVHSPAPLPAVTTVRPPGRTTTVRPRADTGSSTPQGIFFFYSHITRGPGPKGARNQALADALAGSTGGNGALMTTPLGRPHWGLVLGG